LLGGGAGFASVRIGDENPCRQQSGDQRPEREDAEARHRDMAASVARAMVAPCMVLGWIGRRMMRHRKSPYEDFIVFRETAAFKKTDWRFSVREGNKDAGPLAGKA